MIRPFVVEVLENRIAPAGVITGSFKDGILSLVGDQEDNHLSIYGEEAQGGFTLISESGDLKINGRTDTSLFFEGLLKGIRVRMGQGNDTVYLNALQTLENVQLQMGNGENTVEMTDVSVSGAICYSGGAGNDTLGIGGASNHAGSITFNGGTGDNALWMGGAAFDVDGEVNYQGGKGADDVDIGGYGGEGYMHIGGGFTMNFGGGENSVYLRADTLTVQDGVKIRGGNGSDKVFFECDTTMIGGDVNIALGDGGVDNENNIDLTLGHTQIDGAVNVTMGAGTIEHPDWYDWTESVWLYLADGKIAGGLSFQTGTGNHYFQVYCQDPVTLGPITVKTGKGNDEVGLYTTYATVGQVNLQLGDGNNSVDISPNPEAMGGYWEVPSLNLHLQGLSYTGGSGTNTFSIGSGEGYSPLVVPEGIKINTGAGSSTVYIEAPTYLGGSIQITGGAADDKVNLSLEEANLMGAIQVQAGAGNNTLEISGEMISADSLGYTTGAGDDSFSLRCRDLKLTGPLQLLLGEGSNEGEIFGDDLIEAGSFILRTGGGVDSFDINAGVMETTGMFSVSLGGTKFADHYVVIGGAYAAWDTYDTVGAENTFNVTTETLKVGGKLDVTTKAGKDSISISSTYLQSGPLTISSGDGGDNVKVDVNETALVFGPLTLLGGKHPQEASSTNFIARDLHVDGGILAAFGDGESSFTLDCHDLVEVKGTIQVSFSGDGEDTAQVQSHQQITANEVEFHAGKGALKADLGWEPGGSSTRLELNRLSFIGGEGDDAFTVLNSSGVIHGGMNVSMGEGFNSLQVNDAGYTALIVEGGVSISSKTRIQPDPADGSDQVTLSNLMTGGAVKIQMGDARSLVDLNGCVFPRLGVHLGDGDDTLNMQMQPERPMEIRGLAKVLCEGGNDFITVGAGVTFKGAAVYDGGDGEDMLVDGEAVYQPGQPHKHSFSDTILVDVFVAEYSWPVLVTSYVEPPSGTVQHELGPPSGVVVSREPVAPGYFSLSSVELKTVTL